MTVYAFFRRLVWRHPRRTTLSRDSNIILLLIGGVVLSEWFAEGFRIARYGDPDAAWAVLANPLGGLLGTIFPADALQVGYLLFFWANVLLVSGFLVYLPQSKHLHIVTAFFNAGLRKMKPRGQLPAMDLEAEDARFGVKTIEDLNWKDLLDGFTCTECGRCQEACPAWATGKPLNPKTMIMGIREMSVESEAGVSIIPWIGSPSTASRSSPRPDRRQRHSVRRGVGLPDLWRVRRGLPGADRARRQDRRPAPQPGARGGALPRGADRAPSTTWSATGTSGASRRRRGSTGPRACRSRSRRPPMWSPRAARTRLRSSSACTGSAARRRSTIATGVSPARW